MKTLILIITALALLACTPGITPAQACHSGFCAGGCCK